MYKTCTYYFYYFSLYITAFLPRTRLKLNRFKESGFIKEKNYISKPITSYNLQQQQPPEMTFSQALRILDLAILRDGSQVSCMHNAYGTLVLSVVRQFDICAYMCQHYCLSLVLSLSQSSLRDRGRD